MILGIGTDIVKIDRFKNWKDHFLGQPVDGTHKCGIIPLKRIFSEVELADCRRDNPAGDKNCSYDLEGLAVRFAAKEALFKALSAALVKLEITKNEFSLLFLCRHASVEKTTWDVPALKINWSAIEEVVGVLPKISADLSLSHEKEFAIATVVLSK